MWLRWPLVVATAWPLAGQANAADCWGDRQHARIRPEMSCRRLTEEFLFSLKGASRAAVRKAMGAPGRAAGAVGLHFVSASGEDIADGGGLVDFHFRAGRVDVIDSLIDGPDHRQMEFMWDASFGTCSDFPGSRHRCNS